VRNDEATKIRNAIPKLYPEVDTSLWPYAKDSQQDDKVLSARMQEFKEHIDTTLLSVHSAEQIAHTIAAYVFSQTPTDSDLAFTYFVV
jgi:hypothetical protein